MEILTGGTRLLAHTKSMSFLQEHLETGAKKSNATITIETMSMMPESKCSLTETIAWDSEELSKRDPIQSLTSNLGVLIQVQTKVVEVFSFHPSFRPRFIKMTTMPEAPLPSMDRLC